MSTTTFTKEEIADAQQALDQIEPDSSFWDSRRGQAHLEVIQEENLVPAGYDPTPWCSACGARRQADCHCGPIAAND